MAALLEGVEELSEGEMADLEAIRKRKKQIVAAHRIKKAAAGNRPVLPAKFGAAKERTAGRMREALGALGIDTSAAEARARAESRGRKRARSASAAGRRGGGDEDMADADGGGDGGAPAKKRIHSSKSRSMSRGRALSTAPPAPATGLKDAAQRNKATKMADRAQRRMNKMVGAGGWGWGGVRSAGKHRPQHPPPTADALPRPPPPPPQAKVGEADRVITTKMPKHLFSGKRGKGKTDRR
jgi:nucleolar GTP-binding protein